MLAGVLALLAAEHCVRDKALDQLGVGVAGQVRAARGVTFAPGGADHLPSVFAEVDRYRSFVLQADPTVAQPDQVAVPR